MHLLYILLIGAAILLVLAIGVMTWPICLFLAGVFLLIGVVGDKETPWAKAARSLLMPTFWGLCVLFFVLLILNFVQPAIDARALSRTEMFIMHAGDRLKWTRFSWPAFAALMFVLISVSAWAPQWRLSSRYLFLRESLSRLAIGVGVVASFTFFTNTGVLIPQERRAGEHLSILMRESADREQKTVARHLAYRSLERFAGSLDDAEKNYLAMLVAEVAAVPGLSPDARQELIAHFAERDYAPAPRTPAPPGSLPVESGSGARRLAALSARPAVEAKAATFAEEASRGMKEFVKQSLGFATDELVELAWGYFERIRLLEEGYFTAAATNYLSAGAEASAEPRIERFAEEAQTRLRSRFATARRPASGALVRREVSTALRELYARRVREALVSASTANTAADAAQAALDADDLARADAEVLAATRAADQAEAASKFLTAGEQALGAAEAAEISRRVSAELAIVAGAASSGDDALRAAVIARQALEAAARARAAAQTLKLVRAARAGRWVTVLF